MFFFGCSVIFLFLIFNGDEVETESLTSFFYSNFELFAFAFLSAIPCGAAAAFRKMGNEERINQ